MDKLIERLEAMDADPHLNSDIARALGWTQYSFEGENDFVERGWHSPNSTLPNHLPRWTNSVDDALFLIRDRHNPNDIVRNAINNLGRSFNLATNFFPPEVSYTKAFARFIVAEFLRHHVL